MISSDRKTAPHSEGPASKHDVGTRRVPADEPFHSGAHRSAHPGPSPIRYRRLTDEQLLAATPIEIVVRALWWTLPNEERQHAARLIRRFQGLL